MPEFPSQTESRRFLILETIRENQVVVMNAIDAALAEDWDCCSAFLGSLYGTEKRALMDPFDGIFTPEQLKMIHEQNPGH